MEARRVVWRARVRDHPDKGNRSRAGFGATTGSTVHRSLESLAAGRILASGCCRRALMRSLVLAHAEHASEHLGAATTGIWLHSPRNSLLQSPLAAHHERCAACTGCSRLPG